MLFNMVHGWRNVILISLAAQVIPVKLEEQVGECKAGEWRCGDRSCAGVGAACDGALHCEDGSDEALALCKGTKRPLLGLLLLCSEPWSPLHAAVCPEACRKWPEYCHYALAALHREPGTCVFPPFPSVGSYSITDISPRGASLADFSLSYSCPAEYRLLGKNPRCVSGSWSLDFPSCIPVTSPAVSADYGWKSNCSSGLGQFRCADGACLGRERRCDGAPDCADGSDESACAGGPITKMCVMPQYPEHGAYSVQNHPSAAPGRTYDLAIVDLSCDIGYSIDGPSTINCIYGHWSADMPRCKRVCRLSLHPSVTYYCQVFDENGLVGRRLCKEEEFSGTIVVPECNRPTYYYPGVLANMHCIEGNWDNVAVCQPECGVSTQGSEQLIIGGSVRGSELPWTAVIYIQSGTSYQLTCTGSLISTTLVISAAHCFWEEGSTPEDPRRYAVSLDSFYRTWNVFKDYSVQNFNVSDIKYPPQYSGDKNISSADIALVVLSTPAIYDTAVRPVCIDFDDNFDQRQLRSGNLGKMMAFEVGFQKMVPLKLPFVDSQTCFNNVAIDLRNFITSDKICAGPIINKGGCKAAVLGGGGVSFPDVVRGSERYYLRGVVSALLTNSSFCNVYYGLTRVQKYQDFIREHLRSND